MNGTINTTSSSLMERTHEALQANRKLQDELGSILQQITQRQIANRRQAYNILNCLLEKEKSLGTLSPNSNSPNGNNARGCWPRRYFIDAKKSTPEPNEDTIRRRKWLGGKDVSILLRPWSKSELVSLKRNAEIVREQQLEELRRMNNEETPQTAIVRDCDIDFQRVTQQIQNELATNEANKKRSKGRVQQQLVPGSTGIHQDSVEESDSTPTQIKYVRSVTDYRNKFLTTLSPSINTSPFTKAESLKLLEMVHRHNGYPAWDEVAYSLNTNRTPFSCFRYYQSKWKNYPMTLNLNSTNNPKTTNATSILTNSIPWTPLYDEFLLKYIAACGPQVILNQMFAADISTRFFPHLTTRQIYARISFSLLIPTLRSERWSEDEERRLALCMRIYCNRDSPINEAANHFPDRASKTVYHKWERNMKPAFSSQPYTLEEDRALLKTVQSMSQHVDWKTIASKFPSRRPKSLYYHWMEIAPKEEVWKRCGNSVLSRALTKRSWRQGNGDDENTLTPDDFVLCVRKKPRSDQPAET